MADILMPPSSLRLRPSDRTVKVGVLLASAALHLAVLAILASSILDPSEPQVDRAAPPPIYVEMMPHPLLEGERARLAAQAPAASTPVTRPLTAPRVAVRAPSLNPEEEDDLDRPAPPSPRLAAPSGLDGRPAPPTDGAAAPWQVRPETLGGRVGRTYRLGAGGCRMLDGRLSPAEQQRCDNDFNAAAGDARPIGPRALSRGEARREAEFARDGARALQQYEARRAPLKGGVGIMGPADCVGSNFGIGCAGAHLPPVQGADMHQGATTNIRQPSNKLD